jgi:4-diphosphocytidyl-2-C-methyl-D-erythritol kinase
VTGDVPTADRESAPAKINLALAVTGRREDGYHLLDTLVVHGVAADEIVVAASPVCADPAMPRIGLAIEGRFGAALAGDGGDNLVIRAARLLAGEAQAMGRAIGDLRLTLIKRLPVASGLGGGSSDAAATLRLLDRVWRLGLGRDRLAALSLPLGADLPMCVAGRPLRATGIGDRLEPLDGVPALALVLVNPGVAVATPAVFRALVRRDNPPLAGLPADPSRLAEAIAAMRNDLQPPAGGLAPPIGEVVARLGAEPGCRVARMSGSGASVFGLFDDRATAERAAARLTAARPDWWVAAGETRPSPDLVR